jgi:hypothetical protein
MLILSSALPRAVLIGLFSRSRSNWLVFSKALKLLLKALPGNSNGCRDKVVEVPENLWKLYI